MKKILLMAGLAVSISFTSCMDSGYDDTYIEVMHHAFGNDKLTETNVITIEQLKSKYSGVVFNSTNTLRQITEPMQIRGWVTGNDIQGNIYNEISVEDETGHSILVCISQGGLFGQLPVGAQILVELNDLYIGGYGKQPEIGMPYTNKSGSTYVSRMSRDLWQEHFKRLGTLDNVVPEEFDVAKIKDESYLQAKCGKLMTIKGVKFQKADGKTTFAPEEEKDAANCVARYLVGPDGKNIAQSVLQVRTSTYAKFAATTLPKGKLNITGVFTRYRDAWQILIRSLDDIETAE